MSNVTLSSAIAGINSTANSDTITSLVNGTSNGVNNIAGGDVFNLDTFRQSQMDAIAFQAQISAETRIFEAISNAMKARHDSAMNAIRNAK